MVSSSALFSVALVFCFAYARAEVEDLQPLVKSTEESVQKAKTHVEHMLNLSPIPNEDKIAPVVKNETEHLAYEIKKLATKLQEKISTGEHKTEVKEAVNTAATHLNEAADSLSHVGTNLKEDNTKYYAAAEKVLQETKNIISHGPCPELSPIMKEVLNELTHDVNNYQYGIHDVIGPHGGSSEHGHKHEGETTHHVHQHHGSSSEESSEEHGHNHHHH